MFCKTEAINKCIFFKSYEISTVYFLMNFADESLSSWWFDFDKVGSFEVWTPEFE